uniref:Uncharacterized protein n=1 Tax=Physcomitrium patens TaxID=3218 RepID=A0A2K1J8L9_PHYPA|nr:hypothetical protein PHYPA_021000 [Physcomitrium patens]
MDFSSIARIMTLRMDMFGPVFTDLEDMTFLCSFCSHVREASARHQIGDWRY